jgi:hypothetical protein
MRTWSTILLLLGTASTVFTQESSRIGLHLKADSSATGHTNANVMAMRGSFELQFMPSKSFALYLYGQGGLGAPVGNVIQSAFNNNGQTIKVKCTHVEHPNGHQIACFHLCIQHPNGDMSLPSFDRVSGVLQASRQIACSHFYLKHAYDVIPCSHAKHPNGDAVPAFTNFLVLPEMYTTKLFGRDTLYLSAMIK